MNMELNTSRAFSIKLLIMYMISALLFLSSIELHIHTHESAVFADHGAAVSFTSLPDDYSSNFAVMESASEIEVSPDGMLSAYQSVPMVLAIFFLLVLIVNTFVPVSYSRTRKTYSSTELPFYGTPALRAPPQYS